MRTFLIALTFIFLAMFSQNIAYSQVTYFPNKHESGFNCKFLPMTSYTIQGFILQVHRPELSPEELSILAKVLSYEEAKYVIDEPYIMIPCEYYSDITFIMNISEDYVAIKEKAGLSSKVNTVK